MFTDNNSIKLISDPKCHKSHSVRIILREKDIISKKGFEDRVEYYTIDKVPPEYATDGTLPTFIDRDIQISNEIVISEYLDDRYPHPSLLPIMPLERVASRTMMHRICINWHPIMNQLMAKKGNKQMLKDFADTIISYSPRFEKQPYFVNNEFTLADAFFIPVLWRLGEMGIIFPRHRKTKGLIEYMERLFKRKSVLESLSDYEKEFVPSLQ